MTEKLIKTVYGGNGGFYKEATKIANESHLLEGYTDMFMPLILQGKTQAIKKYRTALIEKIKKGEIAVGYILSLPKIERAIIKYVKENGKDSWIEIKRNWIELTKYLGCVALQYMNNDTNLPKGVLIGDYHTLIKLKENKDAAFVGINYITNGMSFYMNQFNMMWEKNEKYNKYYGTKLKENTEKAIQNIEKKLTEEKHVPIELYLPKTI